MSGVSRSQIKERSDHIEVNGAEARLSHKVHNGDHVDCSLAAEEEVDLVAEDVDFEILFETDSALVINKPAGLVVHPGAGNTHRTLVNGLLRHIDGLDRVFGPDGLRPGIVHRLDKDTSGVMVVAKTTQAHEQMSRQFRNRRVRKMYLAICKGIPRRRSGTILGHISREPQNRKRFRLEPESRSLGDRPPRGKPSKSLYRVLGTGGGLSLVAWRPVTGRTHQLRVHSMSLGCPILGDGLYSRGKAARMYLHAYALEIALPPSTSRTVFAAPPDEEFLEAVSQASLDSLEAIDWLEDIGALRDALVAGKDLFELLFPRSSADRDWAE